MHTHKLDPARGCYVAQTADGLRVAEPWEIDIPLNRLTPRQR